MTAALNRNIFFILVLIWIFPGIIYVNLLQLHNSNTLVARELDLVIQKNTTFSSFLIHQNHLSGFNYMYSISYRGASAHLYSLILKLNCSQSTPKSILCTSSSNYMCQSLNYYVLPSVEERKLEKQPLGKQTQPINILDSFIYA